MKLQKHGWKVVSRFIRPATLAAFAAAVPQLVTYAGHVRSGQYPGSAYEPRVSTMLRMSASAAEGGPFATVRNGARWRLAAHMVPDLGVPALLDLAARLTGRAVGVRALGLINLTFLFAALLGLVMAFPPYLRWALVPVFLLFPLCVPEYQSPDTVAIHGALAALGIASAVFAARPGRLTTAALAGIILFGLHKTRSVYGLYGLLAMMSVVFAVCLRIRKGRIVSRLAVAVVSFGVLQLAWMPLMNARANDPRVVDRGIITSHDVYAMLISGVGWSPNRWGIEAADPKVVMFIARRLQLAELPRLDTTQGEKQARRAYLSLWREDPLHVMSIYLARIPKGVADYFVLGLWGAPVFLGMVVAALAMGWRRRDAWSLAVVSACTVLSVCLLGQVALVDPRFIYAYPLRFVSALTLAVSCVSVLFGGPRRTSEEMAADQGAANSSRG